MIVPEAAEVGRYAAQVLARAEFAVGTAPAPSRPGAVGRALEWLAAHPLGMLGNMDLGTVLLIGVGAVAAVFLARWVVRWARSGGFRLGTPRPAAARPASDPARRATAADSLRAARAALAAADARAAIQALLRACLDHLAALGAIRLERWKTNTAYLRECPSSSPSYDLFKDLARAHSEIIYAHRSVDAARIDAMLEALAGRMGIP